MSLAVPFRHTLFLLCFVRATLAAAQTFEQRAQAMVDSIYGTDTTVVGLLVHVEAPDRGISWSGASGRSMKGGAALDPEAPFLIASGIKTYVSATILRLVEEGKLTLDHETNVVGAHPEPSPPGALRNISSTGR